MLETVGFPENKEPNGVKWSKQRKKAHGERNCERKEKDKTAKVIRDPVVLNSNKIEGDVNCKSLTTNENPRRYKRVDGTNMGCNNISLNRHSTLLLLSCVKL